MRDIDRFSTRYSGVRVKKEKMEELVHLVVCPISAWGHLRPLFTLLSHLSHVHPQIRITVLSVPSVIPRIKHDLQKERWDYTSVPPLLAQELIQRRESFLNKLRFIGLEKDRGVMNQMWDPKTMDRQAEEFGELLEDVLVELLDQETGGKPHLNDSGDVIVNQERRGLFILIAVRTTKRIDHSGYEIEREEQWPKPKLFIYDGFQVGFIPALEAATKRLRIPNRPKTMLFFPCLVSWAANCWATVEEGSDLARAVEKTDRIKIATGLDEAEAMGIAFSTFTNDIIKTPGLDPIYDHEYYQCYRSLSSGVYEVDRAQNRMLSSLDPQFHSIHSLPSLMAVRRSLWHQREYCDGFIFSWDPELEPEAREAFQRSTGKSCWPMGLQLAPEIWEGVLPRVDEQGEKIVRWLDHVKDVRGSGSVLYICFGSLFWPMRRPDLIETLLKGLVSNDQPFILFASAPNSLVTEEMRDVVNHYEWGYMKEGFGPQDLVLKHDAVGFFLSHMGTNSVAESILAGKPFLCMPYLGDQPDMTQRNSQKTFDGQSILNTPEAVLTELAQVLGRIRGEEGLRMRENVIKLRERIIKSWREGGARNMIESFCDNWA
ncbi:hypothetical protein TREMEDRAFT_63504 [Tremella mesenterica DSM 1558]|uniref:uncharacterized protein n=1 Tax=Tremella mesenterica (strain ATCC 24925 / CBS 8224 / DSM 1558 / NBRC 9311 / NRRL Y-6157 / RJB 2259-6 / UBC 559-6) TaxID=578456 RepID=UPI0003F48F61|nr:uncharacterized protein TREMEDRAFT_63504 [Tremella mesenterica DSM 1558]EIW68333.1 hypothetical protein TREMEDRAFT_63504 [Tremella mesenterica DSM 1558]